MKKCKTNTWDEICGCPWNDAECPNAREIMRLQAELVYKTYMDTQKQKLLKQRGKSHESN